MPLPPTGNVTFLLSDTEGTLRLWKRRPAALAAALADCDQRLRGCIEEHQGHIFQAVYHTLCAAFPSASLALEAALAGQLALTDPALPRAPNPAAPLSVRMALRTGSAEERGGSYFGPPLSHAVQILAAGYGGQVLLSQATQAGVQAALRECGQLRNEGKLEPVFQLLHPSLPSDFPPLRPLPILAFSHNLPLPPAPANGEDPGDRARALYKASREARSYGDYRQAQLWQQESMLLVQQLGDLRAVSTAITGLGNINWEQNNYAEARSFLEQVLPQVRHFGDAREIANSVSNLANAASYEGDLEAAWPFYEEALALYRRLEDPREVASMFNNLSRIASERGDLAAARALQEEALASYRQWGDQPWIARSLSNLGRYAFEQRDYVAARAYYEQSLALWRELGDQESSAASSEGLALIQQGA